MGVCVCVCVCVCVYIFVWLCVCMCGLPASLLEGRRYGGGHCFLRTAHVFSNRQKEIHTFSGVEMDELQIFPNAKNCFCL